MRGIRKYGWWPILDSCLVELVDRKKYYHVQRAMGTLLQVVLLWGRSFFIITPV
jgi:hypothetical protein